jgi:exosortase D (VPLPA-CTERM-specific)
LSPLAWALLLAAVALACAYSFESLKYMVGMWAKEEYGYAYLLPAVALFIVWQKRAVLQRIPFDGSWAGLALVAIGIGLSLLGELSTLHVVVQYAFLIVIAGLTLTFMGWRGFRHIYVALILLIFMIPLPNFLYQGLSGELQLLSSRLGVAIMRLFGVSVFLEGNVIDLGSYKLQVAEACNGLRYLFPLMALGFIAAYFFKGALWKRALIFISTVPITIFMNSFRIGVIGIMVEYWGRAMAEGFLHDFEGWAIFMLCTAILVGEMWLLARIGPERRSLREAFGLEFPAPIPDAPLRHRAIPTPFVGALGLLAVAIAVFVMLPPRAEDSLVRRDFAGFPLALERWEGRPDRLDQIYLDVLKPSDYLLVNFVSPEKRVVNFYVAYYASQRKGESAHSPRSCIPGGGWEITSLARHAVDATSISGAPLMVNRAVIQKGGEMQVVYYWFQERGRNLTNEYTVKWYLFWDALIRNRTDGALIRLMISVPQGGNIEDADAQLTQFARIVGNRLSDYVPG